MRERVAISYVWNYGTFRLKNIECEMSRLAPMQSYHNKGEHLSWWQANCKFRVPLLACLVAGKSALGHQEFVDEQHKTLLIWKKKREKKKTWYRSRRTLSGDILWRRGSQPALLRHERPQAFPIRKWSVYRQTKQCNVNSRLICHYTQSTYRFVVLKLCRVVIVGDITRVDRFLE